MGKPAPIPELGARGRARFLIKIAIPNWRIGTFQMDPAIPNWTPKIAILAWKFLIWGQKTAVLTILCHFGTLFDYPRRRRGEKFFPFFSGAGGLFWPNRAPSFIKKKKTEKLLKTRPASGQAKVPKQLPMTPGGVVWKKSRNCS